MDLARAAELLNLEERLAAIPTNAKVRGVFFHLVDSQLRRRGLALKPEWLRIASTRRYVHVLYPAADLCRALAVAGALFDHDARKGVREIFYDAASFAADSWFGRVFRTVMTPDPLSALRWLERSREYACNYGRWRLEERGPGRATLHMFDEYCWIDTLHRGGCEGMLRACGVHGTVEASLDGPFQGRLEITWRVRN